MASISRDFFIELSVLKEEGMIIQNVDDEKLRVLLYRCQDLYVEPIMGTTLYKKLLADIAADTLTGIYETIVNDYLLDCLIAFVDYMYSESMTEKLAEQGKVKYVDPNFQTADDTDSKLSNTLRITAYKYRTRLIGYLKDNKDDIPEYKNYVCSNENVSPDKATDSRTSMYWV